MEKKKEKERQLKESIAGSDAQDAFDVHSNNKNTLVSTGGQLTDSIYSDQDS